MQAFVGTSSSFSGYIRFTPLLRSASERIATSIRLLSTKKKTNIRSTYSQFDSLDYSTDYNNNMQTPIHFSDFSQQESSNEGRIHVGFRVYKSKSALLAHPLKPTFKKRMSGSHALTKEGGLFLEFSNSIGVRKYDWENKLVFCLNVFELGRILSMIPHEHAEFYHDPMKGKTPSQGVRINKILKIDPLREDSGFMFSLTVKSNEKDERISVPISNAELSVLKCCINYIMPYIMGWHTFAHPETVNDLCEKTEE